MSKKKTYLYHATEESCFETNKYPTASPIAEAKELMADEYLQTDEISDTAYRMECDLRKNGFAICETVQGQGYRMLVGIATEEKCAEVERRIEELRAEALAEFEEEDDDE